MQCPVEGNVLPVPRRRYEEGSRLFKRFKPEMITWKKFAISRMFVDNFNYQFFYTLSVKESEEGGRLGSTSRAVVHLYNRRTCVFSGTPGCQSGVENT